MFITTCNRFFHKHQRVTFIVIGLMIIIPFVLIWGPGDFLSRGNSRFGRNDVGQMYGKTVSQDAFIPHIKAVCLRYGRPFESSTRDQLTEGALLRMCLLREAGLQGFAKVSDEDVAKEIKGMRDFQGADGAFSEERFSSFIIRAQVQIDSRTYPISGAEFDEIVRENIAITRLVKSVEDKAAAPKADEIRKTIEMLETKYSVAEHTFKSADFVKQAELEITDASAKAYYAEKAEVFRKDVLAGKTPESIAEETPAQADNIERYLKPYYVPEQKTARVAVFSAADFSAAVAVTDAMVKAYYEQHKAEYEQQVDAAHILLGIASGAKPEEKAAKRKQLEEIRAKIVAGAKFEDLAKANSDCPSKSKGGDLGFFGKGQMVPPFEDAAFALKKGELSGIVESPFGLHLIKCLDVKPARSFETVKAEIRPASAAAEAARLARSAAEKFGDAVYKAKIDNQMTVSVAGVLKEFSGLAAKQGIPLEDTALFRADLPTVLPFGDEPELARQAGALDEVRPLSDVVVGDSGTVFYVACHLSRVAGSLPTADDPSVMARLRKQMCAEKAMKLCRDKAFTSFSDLTKTLETNPDFAAAAAAQKITFAAVPEFSAMSRPERPEFGMLPQLLGDMKEGRMLAPFDTEDGAVLVYYKSKKLPAAAEMEAQKARVKLQLEARSKNAAVGAFFQKLYTDAKVVLSEGWQPKGKSVTR